MTDQFDASLARLRNARQLSTAYEQEPAPTGSDQAMPEQPRRSQPLQFATASAGHLPDFDEVTDYGGKPRFGLAPKTAIAAMIAVLTLGGGVAAAFAWSGSSSALGNSGIVVAELSGNDEGVLDPDPEAGVTQVPDMVPEAEPVLDVVVHIAGEVTTPGIVFLTNGSRVADALIQAGGATADAELTAINLARLVIDGEQIIVPKIGAEPTLIPAQSADLPAEEAVASGAGNAGAEVQNAGKININTADTNQLQQLPGIGPALAQRIIQYRQVNGDFTSINQLQEVKGIGPAVMSSITELITV